MPNLFVFDYMISICRMIRVGHTAIPEFVEAGYSYYHDCQHPFNLPLAYICAWMGGHTEAINGTLC